MKIPYFDAHCDTPVPLYYGGGSLYENSGHLDLKRLGAYAPAAQVFSVCVAMGGGMAEETEKVLRDFLRRLEEERERVTLCLSAADIRRAAAEGKIAALLSVEGMEKLDCSLEGLSRARGLGVRIVHLTWNCDNALSGAAMDGGGGLTEKGRAFVPAAQDMGMVLDLSHISRRGFWDVMELAKKPVLAGHSDSMALQSSPRNLTDRQFKAIAASGGVVGLNFYPEFLGLGRDIDAVIAHAEHFLALDGEKALCLGGDLDGIETTPAGIAGVQDVEALYEAMLRRNWSEDLVRDIFYGNLMSFMERAL